ncbi:TetR/AcrR family transcriptional regulator [Fertoebacter nigrum]|uniref:TetR/AcrR family transcriptional regulator n=2 Tax=Fertoeibacter niger TaxID=2656921 RepID=A0A8X8GW93_9RHOB|nr:TetR/AcrR family transcriptional regulator [Fertoeibacter niger]
MKGFDSLPLPKRILQAGFVTFVERGYDKASMDEVAAVAGTTKRTVYAHFGNKETLFRAALGNAVERFLAELPDLDHNGDPERELFRFAALFSELCTWRRAVLLQRVVIGESERSPDLGEMMHRDVILRAEALVADFLVAQFTQRAPQDDGTEADWAIAMARLFLNMATGPQRVATLMEARIPAPDHPLVRVSGADDAWVRLAVRFFLDGLSVSATRRTPV